MTLREWIERREGGGGISFLTRKTGLAYSTVFKIVHGQRKSIDLRTAKLISAATGGEVSIEDLDPEQAAS